jgi:putative endopeptidase
MRHFSPKGRAQIDDVVAALRIALKGRIQRLDWMSRQIKLKALDKLARLKVKIAYPDKWLDYSALEVRSDDLVGDVLAGWKFEWLRQVNRLNSPVDRDEWDWDMSPQTVNASYYTNLNEMVLPAGILQPPFFDPAADPAVNYGGIGATIGHEIIHAFDDVGRKYDGDGALSDWWTHADAKKFDARTAMLRRQFDAYEAFPGIRVKSDLTMSENIADLGGALVALDAYHISLRAKPAPVIDGLTGDQRFFNRRLDPPGYCVRHTCAGTVPRQWRGAEHGFLVRSFQRQARRQTFSCIKESGANLVKSAPPESRPRGERMRKLAALVRWHEPQKPWW